MIGRAQMLVSMRRVLPHGSWRRLGDLIDAAGDPKDVVDLGEVSVHLGFALVIDGYLQVRVAPGEPARVLGPGEVFGGPAHALDPTSDGPAVLISRAKGRSARYLRFPDRLLHGFHTADPGGVPGQLPGL